MVLFDFVIFATAMVRHVHVHVLFFFLFLLLAFLPLVTFLFPLLFPLSSLLFLFLLCPPGSKKKGSLLALRLQWRETKKKKPPAGAGSGAEPQVSNGSPR